MLGIAILLIGFVYMVSNLDDHYNKKLGNAAMIVGVVCTTLSFMFSETFI